MEIIKMTQSHIEQIAQLEIKCFSDPWSIRSVEYELTNPLSLWLVAVEDDRVLGYVGSQTVLGESDMMNLAVDPQYRNKGIGNALVCRLIEELRLNGSSVLLLEVRASNENAIRLYEKLGFCCVGRRRNYYVKPKEDALILRKEWTV